MAVARLLSTPKESAAAGSLMLRNPISAATTRPKPISATGQPSANRPAGPSVKPTMKTNRHHPCADVEPIEVPPLIMLIPVRSDGVGAALAGTNPYGILYRQNEDLAIADPARPGRGNNGLGHCGGLVVLD